MGKKTQERQSTDRLAEELKLHRLAIERQERSRDVDRIIRRWQKKVATAEVQEQEAGRPEGHWVTLSVAENTVKADRSTLLRAIKKGDILGWRPEGCAPNAMWWVLLEEIKKKWPPYEGKAKAKH